MAADDAGGIRAVVTRLTARGIFVQTAEQGPKFEIGPCEYINPVKVGDRVVLMRLRGYAGDYVVLGTPKRTPPVA